MLRKTFDFLKEARGNVLWNLGKWVFAGALSLCAIVAALINDLPWVYVIPITLACGIVFALVVWGAIRSMRRLSPEPAVSLHASLEELKKLRDELGHIFRLAQLSLLAKPLDALERMTWVIERSRILIKQDVFTDYISASDRNRYDTPYNEDDLINIEKQYEKRGYLENVDATDRALFRHLYERCKRLDEVIGKITRPDSAAASDDRTPIRVAVVELKGLSEEGDVMLGTFGTEELYGARPTLVDVEAYVKRVQASVRGNAVKLSPDESALFERSLASGGDRQREGPGRSTRVFVVDTSEVADLLVDWVDRVKRLIRSVESREMP